MPIAPFLSCTHLDKRRPKGHGSAVNALNWQTIGLWFWVASVTIGCGNQRAPTAINLSAGAQHVCATLSDSSIRCWGSNSSGQLGDDSIVDSASPAIVLQLPSAQTVSAGYDHNCAILMDGSVQCWGGNGKGQLGDGTTNNRSVAGQFVGLSGPAAVVATGNQFSCALIDDGSVQCWGNNDCGQLGIGSSGSIETGPVAVIGLAGPAAQVATGNQHTCALLQDGQLQCWGCNELGQTGTGAGVTSSPGDVPLDRQALEVAVGGDHSCALLQGATVVCWGSGSQGELGTGNFSDQSQPSAALVDNVRDVEAGAGDSCAVIEDGTLQCWGSNASLQLGNDAASSRATPTPMYGQSDVAEVAVGGSRICVLSSDGSINCLGEAPAGRITFQ